MRGFEVGAGGLREFRACHWRSSPRPWSGRCRTGQDRAPGMMCGDRGQGDAQPLNIEPSGVAPVLVVPRLQNTGTSSASDGWPYADAK